MEIIAKVVSPWAFHFPLMVRANSKILSERDRKTHPSRITDHQIEFLSAGLLRFPFLISGLTERILMNWPLSPILIEPPSAIEDMGFATHSETAYL
jgi:hypothetical protein